MKKNIKARSHVKRMKSKLDKLILTIFMAMLSLIFVFPIILTVTNSFMNQGEIEENYKPIMSSSESTVDRKQEYINLKLIPDFAVFTQYYTVLLKRKGFLSMFWNSTALVVPIIIGQAFIASLAAYAFSLLHYNLSERIDILYEQRCQRKFLKKKIYCKIICCFPCSNGYTDLFLQYYK